MSIINSSTPSSYYNTANSSGATGASGASLASGASGGSSSASGASGATGATGTTQYDLTTLMTKFEQGNMTLAELLQCLQKTSVTDVKHTTDGTYTTVTFKSDKKNFTIKSANVNIASATDSNKATIYTRSQLTSTYKFSQDIIDEYFIVSQTYDGATVTQNKYTMKPNSPYKTVAALRTALYNDLKDKLILANFIDNNYDKSNSNTSTFTKTTNGTSFTISNYNKYADEINQAAGDDVNALKQEALEKLVIDFSAGNMTVAQLETILGSIGVKNKSTKLTNGSYEVKFSFNNKEYYIRCNKEAAAKADDDINTKIYTAEEYAAIPENIRNEYLEAATTVDGKITTYRLKEGKTAEDLETTIKITNMLVNLASGKITQPDARKIAEECGRKLEFEKDKLISSGVWEDTYKITAAGKTYTVTYILNSNASDKYVNRNVYDMATLANYGVTSKNVSTYFDTCVTEDGVATHFAIKSGWTLAQIKKDINRTPEITRDENGKITKKVDTRGNGVVYTYHYENGVITNQVVQKTNGDRTTYHYQNGKLSHAFVYTKSSGACKKVTYDSNGNSVEAARTTKIGSGKTYYGTFSKSGITLSTQEIYDAITSNLNSTLINIIFKRYSTKQIINYIATGSFSGNSLTAQMLEWAQPGKKASGTSANYTNYTQTKYADFIKTAIENNVTEQFGYQPEDMKGYEFGPTSAISKKMAYDSDMKNFIKNNFAAIKNGTLKQGTSFSFNSNKDLAYSIHGVSVVDSKLTGTKLKLTLFDIYDFDYKKGTGGSAVLNNAGAAAMEDGKLIPYFMLINVEIDLAKMFTTTELKSMGIV